MPAQSVLCSYSRAFLHTGRDNRESCLAPQCKCLISLHWVESCTHFSDLLAGITSMRHIIVIALLSLAVPVTGSAAAITYDVDLQLPTGVPNPSDKGGVTGTITTDGTFGPLSTGDILSWDLDLTVGSYSESLISGSSYVSSNPIAPPCILCTPPPIRASRSRLIFNFAQTGTLSDPGLLRFQNSSSALLFLASVTGFPHDGLISAQIDTSPTAAVFAQLGRRNGAIVIGVRVPEPGTLALMLAGLGVLGFFATRRRVTFHSR
jgi:hypothetical protein